MTQPKTSNAVVNDKIQELAQLIVTGNEERNVIVEEACEVYAGMCDVDICEEYSRVFDIGYETAMRYLPDNRLYYARGLAENYVRNISGCDFDLTKQAYLNQLMTLLRPKLKFYVWNYMSKNDDNTEDVLHNALEKICLNIDMYDPKFRFTTWAFSIAKREALNWHEHAGKMETIDLDECFASVSNALIDDSQEILESEYRHHNILTDVYSIIQAISMDEQNFVVIEKDVNHRKCKEIADQYSMNENTVKTRISAGRRRIREIVVEKHPDIIAVKTDTRTGKKRKVVVGLMS
jgi:RNA polymerase sigma-70 factor (ECF subfamily)